MKTFKRIYIEITNACNLSCSFCPPTRRPLSFMSVHDFEMVLKGLKGHGKYIYLHVKGEPLLHPDFDQILALAASYGFKVNLTSNGSLIKNHKDLLVGHEGLRQVSFSLQSQEDLADMEGYSKYMEDLLDVVIAGVKDSEIIYELRLWNYDPVHDQSMVGKNHLAIEMIKEKLDVTQDVIDAIPKGKGTKLKEQVYLSKAAEFQWPDMDLSVINESGTCYGLRQQVGILVNGDVIPCCLDAEGDMVLGNIFEEEFEAIVTSARASAMITGFEQGRIVEALCKRCGYRSRFSGK